MNTLSNGTLLMAALTGLLAGAVHVWSGPDHLAAIAPLAVRQPRRAWLPGARWGLGHSAGVALVGVLSLWLREWLPLEALSAWGERMVGVMLLGIGGWGFYRGYKIKVHAHSHAHDGREHVHVHVHGGAPAHDKPRAHGHAHVAFGIGILHGLAGSSHFLGVLPVLMLPTRVQAGVYLGAFAAGTIGSMASFSAMMGWFSSRYAGAGDRVYKRLMIGCGAAAMGVGGYWLVR